MQVNTQQITQFTEALWAYYAHASRDELPWRHPEMDTTFDPYKIMVSELMLQQTQVARVIPKYTDFLLRFPTIEQLASATLGDVLRAWQGLGYNRRAKFLWQTAQILVAQSDFPKTIPELVKLPGIGKNTAGAILAYTYNLPTIFIETNVRTVCIHHFFVDQSEVSDKEIEEVVRQILDTEMPREFYWALMDYGSHLKSTNGNNARASKHFVKQTAFHGSKRQIRGQILRSLSVAQKSKLKLIEEFSDDRTIAVVEELQKEGLIREDNGVYSLG